MNYSELVIAVSDYCENTFPTVDMNIMIRQAEQRIYNTVQLSNLRKNVTGTVTAGNQYLSAPDDPSFLSAYSLAVIDGNEYLYLLNKDVNFMREAYPNTSAAYRGKPKHYAIFGPQSTDATQLSFILGPIPDTTYSVELHYYYYPESIVQRAISGLGTIVPGSGYANQLYLNVPLTGSYSGSGATANIQVTGGVVVSVRIVNPGYYYAVGDSLTGTLGTTGSGFSVPVATVSNANGETWLGEHFDSALLNGTMVEAIRYMKGEPDLVKFYQDMYMQSIALLKNLGDGKQRMDAYRDGQVRTAVQ
jgi:hypothetical protein